MMTPHIIIIEDDEAIADAIAVNLQDIGYEVTSVTDAEKGLVIVQNQLPHIILLDVLLSGSDGREVCNKLKRNPKTRSIPLIMMTAHPSLKDEVLNCGADAVLAKPFEFEELATLIKSFLS